MEFITPNYTFNDYLEFLVRLRDLLKNENQETNDKIRVCLLYLSDHKKEFDETIYQFMYKYNVVKNVTPKEYRPTGTISIENLMSIPYEKMNKEEKDAVIRTFMKDKPNKNIPLINNIDIFKKTYCSIFNYKLSQDHFNVLYNQYLLNINMYKFNYDDNEQMIPPEDLSNIFIYTCGVHIIKTEQDTGNRKLSLFVNQNLDSLPNFHPYLVSCLKLENYKLKTFGITNIENRQLKHITQLYIIMELNRLCNKANLSQSAIKNLNREVRSNIDKLIEEDKNVDEDDLLDKLLEKEEENIKELKKNNMVLINQEFPGWLIAMHQKKYRQEMKKKIEKESNFLKNFIFENKPVRKYKVEDINAIDIYDNEYEQIAEENIKTQNDFSKLNIKCKKLNITTEDDKNNGGLVKATNNNNNFNIFNDLAKDNISFEDNKTKKASTPNPDKQYKKDLKKAKTQSKYEEYMNETKNINFDEI